MFIDILINFMNVLWIIDLSSYTSNRVQFFPETCEFFNKVCKIPKKMYGNEDSGGKFEGSYPYLGQNGGKLRDELMRTLWKGSTREFPLN